MNLVPLPMKVTPLRRHSFGASATGKGTVSLRHAWRLDAPPELAGLECLEDLTFLRTRADCTLVLRIDGTARLDKPAVAHLATKDDAYRLDCSPGRIALSAGTPTGIIRGVQTLRQLAQEGRFAACVIEDEPALAIRAFHIDFRPKSYRLDYLLEMVERLAALKYNFLLIEWENKFPFARRPEVVHPEALTEEDIARLKAACRKYAIEIMPLVQTFGHLEFALSVPRNAAYREVPDDPSEICPLNDDAVEFVRDLVRDVIDGHPESRYVHLGSDETYVLGTCPRCRANCEKVGRSEHFISHMRKLAQLVIDAGKTPVMWNDMLIAHPEAVDMLPKEMVMLDWHYHTFGVYSKTIDAWWHPDKVLTAENADRAPEPHRSEYVRYYVGRHPSDPKLLRSFPYTKYFQDRGFEVIAGPSSCCWGDPGTSPNSSTRVPNVWGFAASVALDGALGCILTSWQVRRHPWNVQWYCIALSAETSWNPFEGIRDDFDHRFMRSQYGVDDPSRHVGKAFYLLDRRMDEDRCDHYGGWNSDLRMWSGRPVAEQLKEKDDKGLLADDAPPQAKAAETVEKAKRALKVFRKFVKLARRHCLDARFWLLAAEETVFRVELFDVLRRTHLARKAKGSPDRSLRAAVRKVLKKGDVLYARARKLWAQLLPPQTLKEEIFIRWHEPRSYLTGRPVSPP